MTGVYLFLTACLMLSFLAGAGISGITAYSFAKYKTGARRFVLFAAATAVTGILELLIMCLLYRQRLRPVLKKWYHFELNTQDFIVVSESVTLGIVVALLLALAVGGVVFRISHKGCRRQSVRMSRGQAAALSSSLCMALVLFAGSCLLDDRVQKGLVINEIGSGYQEGYFSSESYDYIELYNAGKITCCPDMLYLSDDENDLKKCSLDGITIPAGGYVLIKPAFYAHGFGISSEGETVYLSDSFGNIIDSVRLEKHEQNASYSRTPEGWKFTKASPGRKNNGIVKAPELSCPGGFYDEPFDLELFCEDGSKVYYTLDGSVPTEDSILYEKPVRVVNLCDRENVYRSIREVCTSWFAYEPDLTKVDKAFMIRAVAVDKEGGYSDVVTATYFVDMDSYRNKNVLSLVADPVDLFGDYGIYVTGKEYQEAIIMEDDEESSEPEPNFLRHGKEWEREAYFELFYDGVSYTEQKIGLRIQGASTRYDAFKNFSLFSRKKYSGSTTFEEGIFDGKASHSYVLRRGFSGALLPFLTIGKNVAVQKSVPVTLFLDGEYWYDGYLMEKYDETFFEENYNIPADNLVICKEGKLEGGIEDDGDLIGELYSFFYYYDVAKPEDYERFCELVDIQSYIEYFCFNVYTANMDWDDMHNVLLWRSRDKLDEEYADGRWRFALYDMDFLSVSELFKEYYEVSAVAEINSFTTPMIGYDFTYWDSYFYRNMLKNEEFRRQVVITMTDMMNNEFKVDRVASVLEKWGEDITWNDSFFQERPEYMYQYIYKEFQLSGELCTVTVDLGGTGKGTLKVNGRDVELTDGVWQGKYFTDYPITVEVEAEPEYCFKGWTGTVSEKNAGSEIILTGSEEKLYGVFSEKTD